MNKPPLEVADVIRAAGKGFIERQRAWVTGLYRKVLYAIEHCRTVTLGGHRERMRPYRRHLLQQLPQ